MAILIHKSCRVVAGTSMVEHNIKGVLKKKKKVSAALQKLIAKLSSM